MPTTAQIEKANTDLQDALNWYDLLEPETIKRTELGEKLTFESDMHIFLRAIDLYKSLLGCDLENLPYAVSTNLCSCAKTTSAVIKSAIDFNLETQQQNPVTARNGIVAQMLDRWEQDFAAVTPILAYSAKSSADFQRLEREAKGTLTTLKDSKKEVDGKISDLLKSMNTALGEVRDAAKEAGVSKHSQHFQEEAAFFAKSSKTWLAFTVGFGASAVAYVMLHIEPALEKLVDPTWQQLAHHSIPRLIVLFVLTYGLAWSAKNYMAASHNKVINRHRRNALASFQAFIEGASAPETKDAVLLQATHAIFTPQDSGFAKGDSPNATSQVVEIIRGGTKAKDA
jgi:hypothetical protein